MTKFKKTLVLAIVLLLSLSAAVLSACAPRNVPGPENPAPREPDRYDDESVYSDLSIRWSSGTHGAVTSANAYASKAGYDVLRSGGNAFDAAVAVAFALGVAEPFASGVGGGGVMTAYDAKTGQYHFYNFREFFPGGVSRETYLENGNRIAQEGINSVCIPTEVAGLCAISEDFGKLPLKDVIQPAIKLADEGLIIGGTYAQEISEGFNDAAKYGAEDAFMMYADEDGIDCLKEGDRVVNPDYGRVLREIAEHGSPGFYTGWVADAIVRASDDRLGFITADDLIYAMENYPKRGRPLHTNVFGYDIYTANTPSSGGIVLSEALNLLEHFSKTAGPLENLAPDAYIHALATAQQLGYADKRHYIADNGIDPATNEPFVEVPIEGLSSTEYAAQRWDALYDPDGVFTATSGYDWGGAPREGKDFGGRTYAPDRSPWEFQEAADAAARGADDAVDGGTTSFSVADSEGNIVSITQTLNHFWGSYVFPEGCGFVLNNQMTSFNVNPPGKSVHYLAPYKQPVTHMMPTIILRDGKPYATLGSPGSLRIPAAVIDVVLNMIVFDMDIQSAIDAGRVFSYGVAKADSNEMSGDRTYKTHKLLSLEDTGVSAETIAALEEKGYAVSATIGTDLFFGGVQGIKFEYNEDGSIESITGGADPRRDGKALAY